MKPYEISEVAKAEVNDSSSDILIGFNATPCGSQLKLQQSKKASACSFLTLLCVSGGLGG